MLIVCVFFSIECTGDRAKVAFSPFLFDLEAGHWILPKLISWDFPSQLSELVEEEITKSLMMMEEENRNLVEIVVEEETNDRIRRTSRISSHVHSKKEEMLKFNCFFDIEDQLLSQPQSNFDFSAISSSPVAFARRNVRRRLDVVMSSDSEENIDPVMASDSEENNFYHGAPLLSGCALGDTVGGIQGVNSSSPVCYFPIERCCHPSEQLSLFDRYKVEQESSNYSETPVSPYLNRISSLVDVSSVPESSVVPETQVINESELFSATVTYSPHVCTEDVDSMKNYLSPSLSLVEREKLYNALVGSYSDIDSLHAEVVGDSQIIHADDVAGVHQELDECSRCEIARMSKALEKPGSYWPNSTVKTTWQRLRNCHADLKQHVAAERKDASHVLELAFGMSNLISEADILLSYCQPHTYVRI